MFFPLAALAIGGHQDCVGHGDASMDGEEADGGGVRGRIELLEIASSAEKAVRSVPIVEDNAWLLHAHTPEVSTGEPEH
jgi:hypothetical protein